jgi:hypothetical protein
LSEISRAKAEGRRFAILPRFVPRSKNGLQSTDLRLTNMRSLESRIVKLETADGLAQLAEVGFFREVRVK